MKRRKKPVKQTPVKQANGQTLKRSQTEQARERVLAAAREQGVITNREARKIGRWSQSWYHMMALCKQGLLKHQAYNEWVPTKRR